MRCGRSSPRSCRAFRSRGVTSACTTSSTRRTSRRRRRRSSGASTSSSASGTSPTPRGRPATVIRSSPPSTSSPGTRRSSSSQTRGAASSRMRRSPRAPAGARSRPSSTIAWSRPTTTSPRAGGRGSWNSRARWRGSRGRADDGHCCRQSGGCTPRRGAGRRLGGRSRPHRARLDPALDPLVRPGPARPSAAGVRAVGALAGARPAGRARRARGRDAGGRGRLLSRRLPESALRPLSARSRRRRRPRRDPRDHLRLRRRDGEQLDGAAGGLCRRDRGGRRHLRPRPLGRGRAHDGRARARGSDDGDLHGGGADLRPAAAHAAAAERLRLAAGGLLDRDLARRRDLRPLCRRELARARAAPARARRPQPRRRRGGQPRGRRRARALGDRRCGNAGDGSGCLGERPDRVRRDHRAAHDPAARLDELPGRRAALAARRRGLPRAHRRGRPHGPLAGGAADRRRHGVSRRAVLRHRAAHLEGGEMIETRDLWVRFGPVAAVRGLSLRAERGGWTALIGPNGAGKTSALRALAGLAAYEGEVYIDGRDARRLGRRAVARLVAFVPQKPETPRALTVAEYVLLGRTPHIPYLGGEGRRDREAAARALRRLELESFAKRPLGSLSGGELQRAVLARALAQEAPLLLLDEPTTALDLGRQQLVLELVDALRADGLTVVTTLHDLTLAGQYAERLVLLDEGSVVAEGTAAEVLSASNVAAHYGAKVRVVEDVAGVFVLPVRDR